MKSLQGGEHSGSSIIGTAVQDLLQDLIFKLVSEDLKIYLEGLGFIYGNNSTEAYNYFRGTYTTYRTETRKVIQFEKSYEINSFHYSKYRNIIETKELACRLHARLPAEQQKSYNIKSLTIALKNFFSLVRSEIIMQGISTKLDKLGTFFALNLSKDLNWRDNFGNADIFLVPSTHRTVEVCEEYRYETPVLKNALEPLETFYGQALVSKTFNLLKEVQKIGFELNAEEQEQYDIEIPISIYNHPEKDPAQECIIYTTDGLQKISHQAGKILGNELCIQTAIPKGSILPEWPVKLIVLGAVLLIVSKNKILPPETLAEFDISAITGETCNLSAIFTSNFKQLPSTYLSLSGKFRYSNILGVTQQEVEYAERHGTENLLKILKHKDRHSITRLSRRNLL